jgi:hypothetical protein
MDMEAAVKKAEQELMTYPNVNGVGIGERNGEPVITVFVTRKLQKSGLKADEIVPDRIAGYPTDIVEIGAVSAQPESK